MEAQRLDVNKKFVTCFKFDRPPEKTIQRAELRWQQSDERDCDRTIAGVIAKMQRVYQIVKGLVDVLVAGAGFALD